MEGYAYSPPPFPPVPQDVVYPDRGDGFGDYYGVRPGAQDYIDDGRRASHSKHTRKTRGNVTHSRSGSEASGKSRSRSHSRSRSRSRSKSRSRSRTVSPSKKLSRRETSFLDAFRVMYLTPSKHKKNTTKYLATKKRQDRIQEILKSDRLGSKRWLFYPRSQTSTAVTKTETEHVPGSRDCDNRIKVDGEFFRKYKRSKKVDLDAPIAKLKRWELILYKKLGFVQSV